MQINDPNTLTLIDRSSKGGEKVELKLDKPISKDLLGKVIKAKITKMQNDGTVRLTLPNGKHITGKLAKPLPEGTQLVFTTNVEGKVKVMNLTVPEHNKQNNKQGGKDNNAQQNNKQPNQEQAAKQSTPVAKQTSSVQNAAKQNEQIPQQPVKIQTVGGKPLPLNLGTRFNVTLTSATPKNGFQQAVLPDAQATKINIQLPKPLPQGTNLTIRILAHNEARVLDVRPPSDQVSNTGRQAPIQTNNKPVLTTPTINNTNVNTVTTNQPQHSPTTVKPSVSENISLSGIAQSKLSESSAPKNITTVDPAILKQIQVVIPQSAKIDLLAQVIKILQPHVTAKPIQNTAQTTTQQAPDTPQQGKQPILTSTSDKKLDTPTLAKPQTALPTPTQPVKIPLNTAMVGHVKTLQPQTSPTTKPSPITTNKPASAVTPSNISANTPTHTLKLPQGISFDVNSSLPIAKGATMAIRFTSDGIAEVLRIVEPTPVGAKQGQGEKQPGTGTPSKNDPPLHHLEKALKLTPGTRFTATVASKASNGLQTLSMPDGRTFQTHITKPLPIGAEVTVKITPNGDAEITRLNLPVTSAKAEALLEFSRRWESLERALHTLRKNQPEAANKLEGKLPNPASNNLLPSLLQFAEAVSIQNASKFLGDETLNLLRSFGIDFTADLSQLNQLQQKSDLPDNWRAFYFPFMTDQEETDQGAFYWRNQDDDQGNSTRFVVNIALSELGPVQIDGLMQENHMMLKVRLHELPTSSFEKELNEVANRILEPLEIQGQIKVEISESFETDPLHDILKHENHTGLVV